MAYNKSILLLVISVLTFTSCIPLRDQIYVQDKEALYLEEEFANPKSDNVIKAFDELYIQVNSFDEQSINFMDIRSGSLSSGARSAADISLISYKVDESGFVELPILGKINLKGLKEEQAAELIRTELESYLNSPSVKVKFVNKRITVIGAVNNPGLYFYTQEYINVFEALGLAQDISLSGNRKNVVIIRENNNIVTKHRINLTDKNIFSSDYYYLSSNDIVYVEPHRRTVWGIETFPYALILSTISTFILVSNYIQNN
jgi:polysaccharide export outer membrane protein